MVLARHSPGAALLCGARGVPVAARGGFAARVEARADPLFGPGAAPGGGVALPAVHLVPLAALDRVPARVGAIALVVLPGAARHPDIIFCARTVLYTIPYPGAAGICAAWRSPLAALVGLPIQFALLYSLHREKQGL